MRFAQSLTPLFSGEMEGWRISSWSLAMCCGRFLSMWAKTFPRSSGMMSPDSGHSISVERTLLCVRLDGGGGRLVALLQNPDYTAENWSRNSFEDNPSFTIVSLWGTGNTSLAVHYLFQIGRHSYDYPIELMN